jgi:hypothetical protein
VIEGDDPRLDVKGDKSRSLAASRNLLNCGTVEWIPMIGVAPRHDLIVSETAGLQEPQPPTFVIGNVHLIGRGLILGVRGLSSTLWTLPLDRVKSVVRFDAGPKVMRQPEFRTFEIDAMMVFRAKRAAESKARFF